MSKYITTKENPIFKKGLKVSENLQSTFNPYYNRQHDKVILSSEDEAEFLERGWIKEVEEKEFTKSDVEEAIDFATNRAFGIPTTIKDIVKLWIKNKDK